MRNRTANPGPARRLVNAFSVDVEDYFQVQAFAGTIPRSAWEAMPRRVERNTARVLDLLAEAEVKATFFTLGWVGQRHPGLVRRIVAEGHELASHGLEHRRADAQSPAAFRADVRQSKSLLEDISGARVRGYRAATFSIGPSNPWAHAVLAEEGFAYSSSVYPGRHDLYGMPGPPRAPYYPVAELLEIPLTAVRLGGRTWPAAGGGYFRLLPYRASRWALRRVHRRERRACVFYMHPWEIDPAQPRQRQAPLLSRLRHYTNLGRMEDRLRRLLRDFAWNRIDAVFLASAVEPPPS